MTSSVPPNAPLILLRGPYLHAIESTTGARCWEHGFRDFDGSHHQPGRLLASSTRVFVTIRSRLTCFDRFTGEVVGTIELGFSPDTALAHDGFFFFSDLNNAACFTELGELLWRLEPNGKEVVCRDANGQDLWAGWEYPRIRGLRSGAIVGSEVSQPDRGDGPSGE